MKRMNRQNSKQQQNKEVFTMTYLVPTTNRIAREIDSMFNSFFNYPSLRTEAGDFMPRVNIRETKDNVHLTFELPGMDKKDIKVQLKDEVLMVSGQREFKSEQKDECYVLRGYDVLNLHVAEIAQKLLPTARLPGNY